MESIRKKDIFEKILPLFLVFIMMLSYIPVQAIENDILGKENLALGKKATAANSEDPTFGADKVTDGIIDNTGEKSGKSRWASAIDANSPWITIDLGENKSFDEVVIQWERKNVNSYKVEVSEDNSTWTTIHNSEGINEYRESLNVGGQNGRYVKITIEDYLDQEAGSDIIWKTVSIYEVEIYNNNPEPQPDPEPEVVIPGQWQNVALNKVASASSTETSTFTAAKAVDGSRERASRWASAVSSEDQWLKVDLGARTEIENIVVEWERKNATGYRIQISDDDSNWEDVYIAAKVPTKNRDEINLNEVKTARYVRLYIDSHLANADGVNWNNVSVYELEIYKGGAPKTLEEIASSVAVRELTSEDKVLPMPAIPEGYEISFIGANYEEVIGSDRTIYTPLVTTKVLVNFEVKKDGKKVDTADIEVVVPGSNEISGNVKPIVIPELREWLGGTGDFNVTSNSRIVISPSSEAILKEAMTTFAKDYKDIVGNNIEIVVSDNPVAGDFYFVVNKTRPELRKEGYYMEVKDVVKVETNEAAAAFLATRSILQILKQNGNTIPQGIVRDYPESDIRGFMLDVGRKPISLDYLYEIMKTMSWYKMNDFQVHLNDNYIWVREYGENAIEQAYAGFRLESNDVGANGVPLTSTDLSYTKKEFGDLIDTSKVYGVNIVPEIESPAHALSFIKAHPEYAYGEGADKGVGENAAMLDVNNPEVVDYIKSIFSEYTDGENPVFRDAAVHIGADEFYGNAEEYRAYTDKILKYIRDEKGRTPRVWGSLTTKNGTTPVTSEGVEMNVWNTGWANPKDMYNQGFDIINTEDGQLYIVPAAGYYYDYLNARNLYNNWEPSKFGNGTRIPAGSPQMRGGMFAVWNDMIDKKANGIVEYDIFDRVLPAMQALSEKMWGKAKDKTYEEFIASADEIGLAPNTNPRHEVESKSETVMNYDFKDSKNNVAVDKSENGYNSVSINNAAITNGTLKLNGNDSYLESPVKNIGPNYSISFSVKRDAESGNEEQVLFESSKGAFKAVQKDTGKLGFSREFYDYSFNYELPKGEWVDITIIGKLNKTELYVNGEYVDEISKTSETGKIGTFVFPLEKIGSVDKSFKGEVKSLLVSNQGIMVDETKIPQEQMTATASSEHPNVGSEGLASFAIDGNDGTMWHTNYNNKVELPQHITLDLGGSYNLNKFTYLPRQSGTNGNITQYEVQVSTNGTDFTKVAEGTWENNSNLKTVKFETPVEATHLRLVAKAGIGGFASAAEINVHKVKEETPDPEPTPELGFKVVTPTEEITVEDNFNIKVGTKNLTAENIYAMQFNIAYDNEKVEFVGAASVDNSKYIISTKDNNGSITVVIATKGEAIVNNTDLINLEFKAKSAGVDIGFNITKGEIANETGKVINIPDETTKVTIVEGTVDPTPEVDKIALKITIDYADELLGEGALEGVVPVVVNEFNKALAEAKTVYENKEATETEVDAAFKRLVNVIWMLEFKQGNKEALETLLNSAKALIEKEYTSDSWAKLQTEIAVAEAVIADENAMQEEVNETFNSLKKAIDELVKKNINKSALESYINRVNGLNKDEYIKDTWNNFEKALDAAKKVLANEDATQEEVDSAYNNLVRAHLGLRLTPDKSKLEDLINKIKDMDLSKYTKESVANLNKELKNANKVLKDKNSTQEEVEAVTRTLNLALASLEEKDSENNNENNDNPGNNNGSGSNNNGNNNSGNNKPNLNTGKGDVLPSTGSIISSTIVLLLGVAAVVIGGFIVKKREENKKDK